MLVSISALHADLHTVYLLLIPLWHVCQPPLPRSYVAIWAICSGQLMVMMLLLIIFHCRSQCIASVSYASVFMHAEGTQSSCDPQTVHAKADAHLAAFMQQWCCVVDRLLTEATGQSHLTTADKMTLPDLYDGRMWLHCTASD